MRPAHSRSLSHIGTVWKNSTSRGPDVVWLLIDEGQDFLLEAPDGGLKVMGQGGQLVRGDQLGDGDRVSVLGFIDRIVDAGRSADRRAPSLLAVVRSGDQLPLLLWKREQ